LDELTPEEASDLFAVARQATASAEARQGSTASNWALKEGLSTGPAVSHLHLHIVPRVSGDFVENDLIYAALDAWSPHEGQTNTTPGWDIPPDSQRTDRTAADMAGEARRYRGHLRTGSDGVMPSEQRFGRFTLPGEQLFYLSPSGLTVAIVNLRPLTPGHVLVLARRCVPRLEDLTADEYSLTPSPLLSNTTTVTL
jgi:diadenosine tetraphosphate (Ap4A) HIT family hydrolase